MSKIIEPTVGRIVYYFEAKEGSSNQGTPTITVEGPLAAIITRVWSTNYVNIHAHNSCSGGAFHLNSLRLVQPGEARPALGEWCEWMPYQIEQAGRAPVLNEIADANARAVNVCAQVDALRQGNQQVGDPYIDRSGEPRVATAAPTAVIKVDVARFGSEPTTFRIGAIKLHTFDSDTLSLAYLVERLAIGFGSCVEVRMTGFGCGLYDVLKSRGNVTLI